MFSNLYGELQSPKLDGWSIVHFAGGMGFCKLLGSDERAVIITSWFAIVWEIYIDEYNNKALGFRSDPKGMDLFGDALITILGAYCEYNWSKSRFKPKITGRSIGVTIELG